MFYKYLFVVTEAEMLTQGFVDTELHPVNGDNVEFDNVQERNQIFYRKALKTKLVFTDDDYSFLKRIDSFGCRCVPATLVVQKLCNNQWLDYWTGRFSFTLCEVNEDDCKISLIPDVFDAYTCILEEGVKQYNMLDITEIKTVKSIRNTSFEYMTCTEVKGVDWNGVDTYICGGAAWNLYYNPVNSGIIGYPNNCAFACLPGGVNTGWQPFWNSIQVNPPGLTLPVTTVWFREVKVTLDIGGVAQTPVGNNWILDSSLILSNGAAASKWYRPPYDGLYYDPLYYTMATGSDCELIYFFDPPAGIGEATYDNGRFVNDTLSFLLDKMECFEGTVKSDLFRLNSDLVYSDPDYVHGGTTQIDKLILFQKSDVRDPNAAQNASLAMISWNELLEILRSEFQAYWKIMPDGTLRIEHVSWFTKNQGLDTTASQYDKFTVRTSRYKFLKEELPSIEKFKWMEAGSIDFIGTDITYSGSCVNRDADKGTKTVDVANVTTDVTLIQSDPDKVTDEGFVMMATIPEGTGFRLIEAVGALSTQTIINAPLSWANLHDKYFRYNRVQESGTLNGANVSFLSWKRSKVQDTFAIELCCADDIDFDFNDLIKTNLGWGEVNRATFSTRGNKLKLTLYFY